MQQLYLGHMGRGRYKVRWEGFHETLVQFRVLSNYYRSFRLIEWRIGLVTRCAIGYYILSFEQSVYLSNPKNKR